MLPKVILVVDDEPDAVEVLTWLFSQSGYKTLSASNGKGALEQLDKFRVDLVVTDVMMPIMDGLQLVEAIRNREKLSEIPIIVNSSLSEAVLRATGKRFDVFVRKPVRGQEMLDLVQRLLAPDLDDRAWHAGQPPTP